MCQIFVLLALQRNLDGDGIDVPTIVQGTRGATRAQVNGELENNMTYVIEASGRRVGRLRVKRTPPRIYIGGIQIAPDAQDQGVGSAVIGDLQREGEAGSVPSSWKWHWTTRTRSGCTSASGTPPKSSACATPRPNPLLARLLTRVRASSNALRPPLPIRGGRPEPALSERSESKDLSTQAIQCKAPRRIPAVRLRFACHRPGIPWIPPPDHWPQG